VQARDYISARFGIHFPNARLAELSRKLDTFASRAGYGELGACAEGLLAGHLEDRLGHLIECITVGETYFFREPEAIEAIVTTIIPERAARGKRSLDIWVAGCATGEEAYSVAMLLHSRLPSLKGMGFSILASDINGAFLERAEQGIYGSWSFRAIPFPYLSRYFHKQADGRYQLDETIRRMVRFQRINLVEGDVHPFRAPRQEFDLILCRNVLMYFAPDTIRTLTARLAHSLVEGGWLMVSQTECCDYFSPCFETVQSGNIFLYRKKNAPAASSGETVPPAAPLPRQREGERLPAAAPSPFPHAELPPRTTPNRPETAAATEERPDQERLFSQARSLADGGELERARQRCEEGLDLNPLSLPGQYLHAVILLELGLPDEALVALRKVLYLNPDFVMASYTLGVIEEKLGNRREALAHFDRTARMLTGYDDNQILPEAEGLTVARLREFINARRAGGEHYHAV
jgi:chemotaxis protein methyltransferase CheR